MSISWLGEPLSNLTAFCSYGKRQPKDDQWRFEAHFHGKYSRTGISHHRMDDRMIGSQYLSSGESLPRGVPPENHAK